MTTKDKHALIRELRAAVAREASVLTLAARSAHEAATHEESRPENDKDTRGLEAAYLAGAQAERARELERVENALAFMVLRSFTDGAPIALSALVEVELDGAHAHANARQWYFIAPVGGGMKASIDGVEVVVVTPQSPVGGALIGRVVGDVVTLRVKLGTREYEICSVQ